MIKLTPEGLVVNEVAPGIRVKEDVLDLTDVSLIVADDLKTMDGNLFHESPIGLWQQRTH